MQTVSRLAVQKKLYETSEAEYKKLEAQKKQYEEAKAEYEAAVKQREEEENKTEFSVPKSKNSVQLLLETRLSKTFAKELEKHEIELKYRKMLTRKRYDYCANYVAQNYLFVFG